MQYEYAWPILIGKLSCSDRSARVYTAEDHRSSKLLAWLIATYMVGCTCTGNGRDIWSRTRPCTKQAKSFRERGIAHFEVTPNFSERKELLIPVFVGKALEDQYTGKSCFLTRILVTFVAESCACIRACTFTESATHARVVSVQFAPSLNKVHQGKWRAVRVQRNLPTSSYESPLILSKNQSASSQFNFSAS